VTLAPAELQIMVVLIRAEGTTVRRAALEAALGDSAKPSLRMALDVAMHRLKRKLTAITPPCRSSMPEVWLCASFPTAGDIAWQPSCWHLRGGN